MAKRHSEEKIGKYALGEVYPNSPLVEVVCEVRFPPELAVECHRDEFYNHVKDRYPAIGVPSVKVGQSPSLTPYHFQAEDKTVLVMLAVDRLSLHSKKYKDHTSFITEFMTLAGILRKAYKVDRLTRVGWRYVNVIPYSREDGLLPLNRFLSLGVQTPEGVSSDFENLSLVFMSKVPEGSITTRIESVIRPEDRQEAILLDFDFALTDNLRLSRLKTYLEKAHIRTRDLFESLITDDYREYLRGKGI